MNGGYCLIDMTGFNYNVADAQMVKGVYNKVYDCMSLNKPCVFNNILSGDNGLYTPIIGACVLGENIITVKTVIGDFTIASNDNVTKVA